MIIVLGTVHRDYNFGINTRNPLTMIVFPCFCLLFLFKFFCRWFIDFVSECVLLRIEHGLCDAKLLRMRSLVSCLCLLLGSLSSLLNSRGLLWYVLFSTLSCFLKVCEESILWWCLSPLSINHKRDFKLNVAIYLETKQHVTKLSSCATGDCMQSKHRFVENSS